MTPAAASGTGGNPGFLPASERAGYITMGKGTRSRNERAGAVIADPSKFSKKNSADKTKLLTRIGVIACAVLLLACIALWSFTTWVPRIKTAAKSSHYRVNGSEMTYFITNVKNNYINTLSSYGTGYLTQLGLSTSDTSLTGLRSQTCGLDKTKSWYEYFVDQTKTQVESMLVLCEAAKAEGMTLDKSELEDIDKSIKAMKDSAEELAKAYAARGYSGYTASYFLTQEYGNGVSESNVRHALELQGLASKFYKAYQERVEAGITDDELEQYVKDNPANILSADIFSYTFTAELEIAGSEATDDEKAAYEKAKEEAKKLADELAACSDKNAFIAKAVEYILGTYANDSFDKYYENNKKSLDDADKPDDAKLAADKAAMVKEIGEKVKDSTKELTEHGDTNSYTKVLDKVSSSLLTDVQNAYDAINKTSSVSYSDPADKDASDSTKWLFDADRKAGDKTVISNEAEKKSTYTAYFMEATAHRDETMTKNVGHILFKTTTYKTAAKAKEKAEEILSKYKEGEQTKDAFEALANEYTEDSSVFYENVTKDYMVKEFDAWTFDSSRKAGDVDIVETTHGAHVMYFVGDGEIAWKVTAKNGVFGEKYEAWYETEKNSVGVTFSDSTMKTLG